MVFRQFYAFFDAMAYGFMMYQNQRVNNEDNTTNTDELSLDFTDLDDWINIRIWVNYLLYHELL